MFNVFGNVYLVHTFFCPINRRKSKDRKRHRSSSKHRSEDYKNRRKRSRSKGRGQFLSSKAYRSPIKETPIKEVQSKVRGEIR